MPIKGISIPTPIGRAVCKELREIIALLDRGKPISAMTRLQEFERQVYHSTVPDGNKV